MKEALSLRWAAWAQGSVVRRIFAAALTVSILGMAAKLVLVSKDVLVARRFGTGTDLDAYLVALLVPLFTSSVIGGSFQAALVPTYVRVRENDGAEQAQALFSGAMVSMLAVLLTTTALLGFGSPWLLGWLGRSFTPEQLVLSQRLLWVLLPLVVLGGLNTAWSAILNASESFALPALAPAITPALVGLGLLALGRGPGVYVLAVGTLVGTALELLALGLALARRGVSVVPRWQAMTPPMRRVITQYLPMVGGGFLSSGTGVVDQAIAARLGAGNVSSLSYGGKVVTFVLALGGTAIGTAVFPYFSRMLATNDLAAVRHTLKTYLPLIFLVTVPVTGVLIVLSEPIVQLAFQRGAFTAVDAHRVATVQAFYLLQIPFTIATQMGVRLMAASMMSWHLGWMSGANFLLNAVLDVILARYLGAPGIALSTALVSVWCFGMVYTVLWRRYRAAEHE